MLAKILSYTSGEASLGKFTSILTFKPIVLSAEEMSLGAELMRSVGLCCFFAFAFGDGSGVLFVGVDFMFI